MAKEKSFKERVKDALIQNAYSYKKYYVDYEYLLCSKAFSNNDYYVVSAYEDNYLHLTGVNTTLGAELFFEKCYKGTLEESDFDFSKKGQNEKEVKGSVRRKINSLPNIMNMFTVGTLVEEDFEKNRIRCELVAGNVCVTLGFVVVGNAKPMTLLKGNELDGTKAKKIDLVLRRKKGEMKFSDMLLGDEARLETYKENLGNLLAEHVRQTI